ncbi:hypothetical protein RI367_005099 [Sorochytrium milnesiophthora]
MVPPTAAANSTAPKLSTMPRSEAIRFAVVMLGICAGWALYGTIQGIILVVKYSDARDPDPEEDYYNEGMQTYSWLYLILHASLFCMDLAGLYLVRLASPSTIASWNWGKLLLFMACTAAFIWLCIRMIDVPLIVFMLLEFIAIFACWAVPANLVKAENEIPVDTVV